VAPDLIDDRDEAQGGSPESHLQFLSRHRESSQRRRERKHRLRGRRRTIAVLLGVAAALGIAAVGVTIWGNFRFLSHAPAAGTDSRQSSVATSGHHSRTHSTPSHPDSGGKPPVKAPPQSIHVRLTAARGASWVEIRAGSSTGRVLFDGVVPVGQSIRAVGRGRLWARFGSLGNFDVTVNGRAVHPAFNGTVDTVITAAAIRRAPAH
jgi:hypothetical protein